MKIEKIKVSQVSLNKDNPRTITRQKYEKLVNSLLILPKMLEIRPIVVNDKLEALGGNMRINALVGISKMSIGSITEHLQSQKDFAEKTQGEQEALLKHWKEWLASPYCYVINASTLSKEEQKQFIIKDNVQFGTWDYDALANKWDNDKLQDWGMDVWGNTSFEPAQFNNNSSNEQQPQQAPSCGSYVSGIGELPDELQGVDMTPNVLPKIEGDDETLNERIIICFPKERKQELANMLGLAEIDKVLYNINDILPLN